MCGAHGVVGLVSAGVERRHDRVAHEFLDLAAVGLRDQRGRRAVIGGEHRRYPPGSRSFRERSETDEVGKQDAHLLHALACRWQIQLTEALLAPLVASREQDDHIGRDDQRVPFPPARMPSALTDQGGANQRFANEHEAGDDARRKQCQVPAERVQIAERRDPVDERSDSSEDPQRRVRTLGGSTGKRRQLHNCPQRPQRHRSDDRATQRASMSHYRRRELRSQVHERRRAAKQPCDQQANRNRDLESGEIVVEENALGFPSRGPPRNPPVTRKASDRRKTRASPRRSAACPARYASTNAPPPTARNSTKCSRALSHVGSSARRRNNDTRPMSGRINATTDASLNHEA